MSVPKPSASLFPVRYTPLNQVTEPITKLLNPKSAKRHNSPKSVKRRNSSTNTTRNQARKAKQ